MNNTMATAIALRDLKCHSIQTVDERILLQKKVYIAQELGLPLGFGYSWYLHGPYSRDLTTATYEIADEGFSLADGKRFEPQYQLIIDCVNSIEEEATKVKLNNVHWYELVASIAYWYKRGLTEKTDLVKKIYMCKPQFTLSQVETAYDAFARLIVNQLPAKGA